MGADQVGLRDVGQGAPQSRARLTAPLRYLLIYHPEKARYDFVLPTFLAIVVWLIYTLTCPKPPLFGDNGLLGFVRDLLIMAVPFMIGALAAVAMGAPGPNLDRRLAGTELYLDGRLLTLRSFVCYLLGYLSFLGLITLGLTVLAALMRHPVLVWTADIPLLREVIHSIGVFVLVPLLSFLSVTVFWSLYFLTDIVNRP
jgi:hypothetical protein